MPATLSNPLRETQAQVESDEALDRARRSDLLAGLPSVEEVVDRVPARHGVWLAVSEDHDAMIVPLAPGVRVAEQVLLDDQVGLARPLLEHEQRGTELLVLTLADDDADLALLDVATRELATVGEPFPFTYAGDGSGTQDRSASRQRDERRRHHWRRVAEAAHRVVLQRDLPVVTVGVDRNQAFLREVSAWPEELAVAVLGSPDAMDQVELIDRVVEASASHRKRRIEEVALLVDSRAGAVQVATGMTDLYTVAVAGRIELVVLVDGPPVAGYLAPSGHLLAEDPGGATPVPDVHAFGVAETVRRGGEVLLAPEGTLDASVATLPW